MRFASRTNSSTTANDGSPSSLLPPPLRGCRFGSRSGISSSGSSPPLPLECCGAAACFFFARFAAMVFLNLASDSGLRLRPLSGSLMGWSLFASWVSFIENILVEGDCMRLASVLTEQFACLGVVNFDRRAYCCKAAFDHGCDMRVVEELVAAPPKVLLCLRIPQLVGSLHGLLGSK